MPQTTPSRVTVVQIPAVRLVAVTKTVALHDIPEHVGSMFEQARAALADVDGALARPVAVYAEAEEGMQVTVGYDCDADAPEGMEVVELPADTAAQLTHHGPPEGIRQSWAVLMDWARQEGWTFAGAGREFYEVAASEDMSDWVTQLQQPITR